MMSRFKLLSLQLMVAVSLLMLWHVFTVYPLIGTRKNPVLFLDAHRCARPHMEAVCQW
jgi:hypothetical protein